MTWLSPHGAAGVARRMRASALPALRMEAQRMARTPPFVPLLAALLAADAILILLHVLNQLYDMGFIGGAAGALAGPGFLIDEEMGYAETFNNAKAVVGAAALFFCYGRTREPVFAALGFALALVVLDEGVRYHELTGTAIRNYLALSPALGVRPQDLGELMAWAMLGSVAAVALAAGFRHSGQQARRIALLFLALFAVLAFFGIVVDMLHIVFGGAFRGAKRLGTVIEDGGEMATLSLICTAAVAAAFGEAGPSRGSGSDPRVS